MMLMVILFVFLHLPVYQMKEEKLKCPPVCQCSNKTVAICKDLKIDRINETWEWKFEDGLKIFDFSGNKLDLSGDTLGEWKVFSLQSFNLSGNNILNIKKFTFAGLSDLENLDLSRNDISSIECEAFELTQNMMFLRLRSNRLTKICPHTFDSLEHLLHLDLSNNMISSIQADTLHSNSVLEWLSLANNRLTEILPDTLRLLRHLRQLDLSNNMISSIQADTLHSNSVLEWLSLANNRLTEILPDTLRLLRHLRHLDLSNNNISSIQPDTLHNNSVLEWLILANNNFTETLLDNLRLLRHLRRLDLSNNMISSIQSEALHNSSALEWLSLANNRLTEIHLDIFRNQKNLSYVGLSGNSITKIEGTMFHRTRKLEKFLLSNNDIFENNASASYKENELFFINVSRNRTERLGSLTFSRNCLQNLRSRSFDNFEENRNLTSTGNNTPGINDEAFVGLETLKYLDVSSNNVSNISLSVFHNILPQNERVASEGTCVSEIKGLNLSNNAKLSFSFGEYFPFNLTSIMLCKMELPELKENCLSIFDVNSANVLNTSGALIDLTDNAYTYECSFFQCIYETMNVTSLNCLSQGALGKEKCNISEHSRSTTVKPFSENKDVPQALLPENILIFGIYASSVIVAIIVVLVITHVVGKPEPDEFWWEDKLAKLNY